MIKFIFLDIYNICLTRGVRNMFCVLVRYTLSVQVLSRCLQLSSICYGLTKAQTFKPWSVLDSDLVSTPRSRSSHIILTSPCMLGLISSGETLGYHLTALLVRCSRHTIRSHNRTSRSEAAQWRQGAYSHPPDSRHGWWEVCVQ